MTTGTTQGFEYSDVVANEKLPLRGEFRYNDGDNQCGYVYAKLYDHEAFPGNATVVAKSQTHLDGGRVPSICHISALDISEADRRIGEKVGERVGARVVADHNVVIGYLSRSVTDDRNVHCDEGEDSILQYNAPVIGRGSILPALSNEVQQHGVRFVRNLIANQTCIAPLVSHINGTTNLQDFMNAEDAAIHTRAKVS